VASKGWIKRSKQVSKYKSMGSDFEGRPQNLAPLILQPRIIHAIRFIPPPLAEKFGGDRPLSGTFANDRYWHIAARYISFLTARKLTFINTTTKMP